MTINEAKAVLFDMDGVLYNSMPNHAVSWHSTMAEYGLRMSEADAYRYEGMRGVETIKLVAREQWGRELSDEEAAAMYARKSAAFAACPPAGIMPGVKDVQRRLAAAGKRIVVVTGSGQHTLLDKLVEDFRGLVRPDLIVSSFDVRHGKPDPEPYIMGLRKAGVEAGEAVVIENAPLGVRSAVAAGIYTIGVNSGLLPDEALRSEGASEVYSNMFELLATIA